MKKIIILLASFLCLSVSYWVKTIPISTYEKYTNFIWKKLEKVSNEKKVIIQDKLKEIEDKQCVYWEDKWFFYISPICFYNWEIPKLDFVKALDISWVYIKNFDNIYDLEENNFYYKSAKPTYSFKIPDLKDYFNKNLENEILDFVLYKKHFYVQIPIEYIALNQINNYSFYIADKDLSKRNKSRLHNFNVALNVLDNYILKPWKILYLNSILSYAKGFVWWNTKVKRLFYGWVCGVSTLLFRNALINPYLYVKERFNHRQRYVNFYSNYIYGDDSSVYEWDKRLKIINTSKYPIYFKKKMVDNKIYLVSIIPSKIEDFVQIKKEQIWKLKAYLSSDTYDKYWNFKYKQSWISRYDRKNYDN